MQDIISCMIADKMSIFFCSELRGAFFVNTSMTKFNLLQELADTVGPSRPFVDKICKLLFRQEAEAKSGSYGLENKQSTLSTKDGEPLMLTFDNSNAQREYELNSLTPLGIEKDSATVKEFERMYTEHGVVSKAKLKFVARGGKSLLRGVNFGKVVDEKVLRMIQDSLVMLSHDFKKTK